MPDSGNVSTNAGVTRVLRFAWHANWCSWACWGQYVINALSKVIQNNTGYDLRQLFTFRGHARIITASYCACSQAAQPAPGSAPWVTPGVLDLLQRARGGFGSQLTAFEVMWPEFYRVGTVRLGRKPPLDEGFECYVLIETLGLDPQADQQRFEAVIAAAMDAGSVKDAIIAQSQRETGELWSVRDSPGEWEKAGHWPQLSFDVSVPTGDIGQLVAELDSTLTARWPRLPTLYFACC